MEINGDYSENLLNDMLNNDDLSDELQDDSTAIAIVGIVLCSLLIKMVNVPTTK